jgi:hypothetical protein
MPKEVIDYSKTIIYKITCGDELYVGHTTNLRKRKNAHKNTCNENYRDSHRKIYQTIRANGGWEKAVMTPIELFPCFSSVEARIREEHWRKELQAEMNMMKAYISEEELKKENIERCKIDREQKKEKYKKMWKGYYQKHKEEKSAKCECKCGSLVRVDGMTAHAKTKKHREYLLSL